jgi:hypothetical protein
MDLWIAGENEMGIKLAMIATEDVFCSCKSTVYNDICEHINLSTRPHHVISPIPVELQRLLQGKSQG